MPDSTSRTSSPPGSASQGHDVADLGTNSPESVDYPDFGAHARRGDCRAARPSAGSPFAARASASPSPPTASPKCRCARVDEPLSAHSAREHNDANVIALGGRLIGSDMAKACVTAFLDTDFAGGRHQRRVDQLSHDIAGID